MQVKPQDRLAAVEQCSDSFGVVLPTPPQNHFPGSESFPGPESLLDTRLLLPANFAGSGNSASQSGKGISSVSDLNTSANTICAGRIVGRPANRSSRFSSADS
jgi:hypothetical protein